MSVGSKLKDARKARQLSFADVTAATKIQPWVLEALEADKLHEQMSPIYARGFLNSYARFLRIPSEPLLAEIQWPGLQAAVQTPSQLQMQSELSQQSAPMQQAKAAAPASAAQPVPQPLVESAASAAPATQTAQKLPSAVKITLPQIQWPQITIPWRAISDVILRVAKPAAAIAMVAAIVAINPLQWLPKFSLPKIALPARSTSSASSRSTTSKRIAQRRQAPTQQPVRVASVAPVPAREAVAVIVTAPPQPAAKIEPLELSVVANKPTWIRVRADGKLVSQQRLERGAHEKWIAKKNLDIVIAKPSQVELSLNGESINATAIQNEGRLAITHQGITKLADDAT